MIADTAVPENIACAKSIVMFNFLLFHFSFVYVIFGFLIGAFYSIIVSYVVCSTSQSEMILDNVVALMSPVLFLIF